MATNFMNSAGTDLESIFEAGTGSITTNFLNSSSQDLGKIFLPVSSGSAASATGFKNSAGTDLGSILCAKGTSKPTVSSSTIYNKTNDLYYRNFTITSAASVEMFLRHPRWGDGINNSSTGPWVTNVYNGHVASSGGPPSRIMTFDTGEHFDVWRSIGVRTVFNGSFYAPSSGRNRYLLQLGFKNSSGSIISLGYLRAETGTPILNSYPIA